MIDLLLRVASLLASLVWRGRGKRFMRVFSKRDLSEIREGYVVVVCVTVEKWDESISLVPVWDGKWTVV